MNWTELQFCYERSLTPSQVMMCEFLLRHGWGRRGLLMLHDFWRRILFQPSESAHICTLPNTMHSKIGISERIFYFICQLSQFLILLKKSLNLKRYRGESNINRVILNRNVYWTGIWGVGVHLLCFSLSVQYLPQITEPCDQILSFFCPPPHNAVNLPSQVYSFTYDLTGKFKLSSEVGSHKWVSSNKMNASQLNFH